METLVMALAIVVLLLALGALAAAFGVDSRDGLEEGSRDPRGFAAGGTR